MRLAASLTQSLLGACLTAMAISAPHITPGYLLAEALQADTIASHRGHVARLLATMVEVKNNDVLFAAIKARVPLEEAVGVREVASRLVAQRWRASPPRSVCAAPTAPQAGPTTVAIHTDDIALLYFRKELRDHESSGGQHRDISSFLFEVIELEDHWIVFTAVDARLRPLVLAHECKRLFAALPLRGARLLPVEFAAVPEVLAEAFATLPLAAAWMSVEC